MSGALAPFAFLLLSGCLAEDVGPRETEAPSEAPEKVAQALTGGGNGVANSLRVWLRADGEVSKRALGLEFLPELPVEDGDYVYRWADSSGNDNDARSPSLIALTTRPVFAAQGANFNPAIRFARDGFDSTFLDTGDLGIPSSAGSTHIVVLRQTAVTQPGSHDSLEGDFIIDRPTVTQNLASLKVINVGGQARLAVQKRTASGANIGGPVEGSPVPLNAVRIIHYERDRGNAYRLYINGALESSVVDNDPDYAPPALRIGRHATEGGGGFTGDIAEVIVFQGALSAADRKKVNSYLSIKYGIALNHGDVTSDDGTGDLVNSQGEVIFDAHDGTSATPYRHAVAGIGHDTVSQLNQKQSRGPGDVLTVGLGTIAASNAANPAVFPDDRSYLVWGHDDGALALTDTGTPSQYVRVARLWRAQESGADITDVQLRFDLSAIALPNVRVEDFVLLMGESADLSTATSSAAASLSSGVVTFSGVDLDHGTVFTVGVLDTDGDGTPDALEDTNGNGDRDDDDTDGDGIPNYVDADDGDVCVPDPDVLACETGDADHDGEPNGSDPEPTDPCVPDADAVACGTGDADHDGEPNGSDPEPTDPCVPDPDAVACGTGDADHDGAPNDSDPEPTNPCAPDPDVLACETGDADHDGEPNGSDPEPTNPCVPHPNAPACGTGDSDGDGEPNDSDPSPTDPCDPNPNAPTCGTGDSDGDGVPNDQDPSPSDPCDPNPNAPACGTGDSDGDGEPNDSDPSPGDPCDPNPNAPTCGTGDSDGDGVPNDQDPSPSDPCAPDDTVLSCGTGDYDGDGIRNEVECPGLADCPDSDGDGTPDWQDTDSDDDGTPDESECPDDDACTDTDGDGIPDYRESDVIDTDGDGLTDQEDTDSDDDGQDDGVECPSVPCADTDEDGIPDYLDVDDQGPGAGDSDGDGIDDDVECSTGYVCVDSDGDGVPDYMDTDSDNDGVGDDSDEAPTDPCVPSTDAPGCDVDGGVPGSDGGADAGEDADGGVDAGEDADGGADAGEELDAGADAGDESDAGADAGEELDGGADAGEELDAGADAGDEPDAGEEDAGVDAGEEPDAGHTEPTKPDAGKGGGGDDPSKVVYGPLSGGAGCSVSSTGSSDTAAWIALLAFAGLVVRRRRWRRERSSTKGLVEVLGALLLAALLTPAAASAQAGLSRFSPAPLASDGFALSRPEVLDHLRGGFQAVVDYANDPLILTPPRGPMVRVVNDHLVVNVGVALGLGRNRFTLFANLPMHAIMRGDSERTPPSLRPEGAGLGDATVGGRLRLVGDADSVGMLSLEFIARLPTADLANGDQLYSGDKIGSYEPALIGQLQSKRFDARLRVGGRFRDGVSIANLTLGHELVFGLGARLHVAGGLFLHAELFGSSYLDKPFTKRHTPFELLAGPKYQAGNLFLGAAAGPGIVAGYGSPDVRVVGMFGYAGVSKPPAEPPPPPPPVDSDGDGVLDPNDACPDRPEDIDGYEDEDGCPDLDDDGDGIPDESDRCPFEPEDQDGFEDEDGCPEADNDGDGFPDESDSCPLEAEDKDGFQDHDGCPDPDNDGDGVPDTEDQCPFAPGAREDNGCPRQIRVDLEKGEIAILQRIEFATGRDTILRGSEALLDEIASTLRANPQLNLTRVEGHTDNVGAAKKNLDLSKRRARSVVRALVERGVELNRLEAVGCGQTRPIDTNKTKAGRQTNRRVEFHIVDPAPASPRSIDGCERLEL